MIINTALWVNHSNDIYVKRFKQFAMSMIYYIQAPDGKGPH